MPNTSFLTRGTTITHKGVEYVILRTNPKNYLVANRANKRWNLNRNAVGIEVTGNDTAWMNAANRERVEKQLAKSGLTPDDENVGIFPSGLPRFNMGTRVIVTGPGSGRYEGREGVINVVNRTRYRITLAGGGQLNVPFSMVVRAPEKKNPLVGTDFRYLIGDEKVLFTITKVDGKVITAVGAKEDLGLNDGRVIPSDYEGVERDFLTAEVESILDFEKRWAKLTAAATQGA